MNRNARPQWGSNNGSSPRAPRARLDSAPRPVTARELAQLCGVELKSVHNWVARGLIPHFRTPGRHLRFVRGDVEDFIVRCRSGEVRSAVSVLVVADAAVRNRIARSLRELSIRWVEDPYAALVVAGREGPAFVVLGEGALRGVDLREYVRSLRRSLAGTRVVWFGRAPRGGVSALPHAPNVSALRALVRG